MLTITEYLHNKVKCPVCEAHELAKHEICFCGWENDLVQYNDHDYKGGANQMSVNEAREAYKNGENVY